MQAVRSYVPFAYVVNYASIIDAAFAKWMVNHNPEFLFEQETGFYVYNGKRLTVNRLSRELWPLVTTAVFEAWDWIQASHPERAVQYLFVANPCGKLNGDTGMNERWKFGEESDVKLNFPMFEETFQKIFDKLFKLQIKNGNEKIFYLQRDNMTYNGLLKLVVERVFGSGQTTDLSTVFVPRHLTDCSGCECGCDEMAGAVLNWIEEVTGLYPSSQR